MSDALTDRQVLELTRVVTRDLGSNSLPTPAADESEPTYTRRCLFPVVRDTLRRINIPGIALLGDVGGAIPRPVVLFGQRFYPDLSVAQERQKLVAVEVKYLRADFRENALATAIGQAYLYRQAGYRATAVLLIDRVASLGDEEILEAVKVCGLGGIELVVRRQVGMSLLEHPR